MLESSVDRLGGAVAGAGPVEVGQDVGGALLQGPPQGADLLQRGGNTGADRGDELGHERSAGLAVRCAVGGDHLLVDAPGGLDLYVLLGREERLDPRPLLVGEQVGTGVQGAPGTVERVRGASAVAVELLLDAAPALVGA